MSAVQLDLTVQGNEDYYAEYQLLDSGSGAPIQINGCTVTMQVRTAAGATGSPMLSAACSIVDGPDGIWSEQIPQAQIAAAAAAAAAGETAVNAAYDVLIQDPTGITKAYRAGAFNIVPGVTP